MKAPKRLFTVITPLQTMAHMVADCCQAIERQIRQKMPPTEGSQPDQLSIAMPKERVRKNRSK